MKRRTKKFPGNRASESRYSLLIPKQKGVFVEALQSLRLPDRHNPKDTENNKGSVWICRGSQTRVQRLQLQSASE